MKVDFNYDRPSLPRLVNKSVSKSINMNDIVETISIIGLKIRIQPATVGKSNGHSTEEKWSLRNLHYTAASFWRRNNLLINW